MAARHYSNTGSDAQVAVLIGPSDTTVALSNYSGFPSANYIAALDPDTSSEEIVLVTGVSGATVTITRAYDGTTAKTHAAGAVFRHVASAKDFQEANDHVNATSGVHGVAGSLVGTSDTQTLTNKTLTTPTLASPTVTGTMTAAGAAFSGTVTIATSTIGVSTGTSLSLSTTLSVTGTSTLHAVNATAISGTTGAFSGAVTLSSTLDVTGAQTGTSLTLSGALTALSSTVTTATPTQINLPQNAADKTANASQSALFARNDYGLYFTPNGQNRRRVSMHWGQGTSLPTASAIEGDTYYHTALGAMMRYNGTNWRQIDGPALIANMAARPTSTDLYEGFQVITATDDMVYTYDGTYWRNGLAGNFVPSGAGSGHYITGLTGSTVAALSGSAINVSFGRTYSAAPANVQATPGDTASGLGLVIPDQSAHTTSAAHILCRTASGGIISGTGNVRVNWTVIGYNS